MSNGNAPFNAALRQSAFQSGHFQNAAQPTGLPTPPSSGALTPTARRSACQVKAAFPAAEALAVQLGVPAFVKATTSQQLKDAVNLVTLDSSTNGGGFTVRLGKPRKSDSRGTIWELFCQRRDSDKCKFCARYEYTIDGFVLYSGEIGHSHSLAASAAQMVASGQSSIPLEYDELGHLLAKSGFSAKDILRVFVTKARDDHFDITFQYRTIYDKYIRVSGVAQRLDACNLLEKLASRKQRNGLQYFVETDGDSRIDKLFVECALSQELWETLRKSPALNALFFDPTFGTNRYGLKLSMFIAIGPDGESRILAYMLHREESFDDVYWGFRMFQKVFRHAPATVLTDSAAGIIRAVDTMSLADMPWSATKHLLCVFHVDQNFYDNVHRLFNNNNDGWNTAHEMFWRLAKDSDCQELRNAASRVDALRSYIDNHGKGPTKPNVLKWFDDVLVKRITKWAACHTWSAFSAGAHATSRAEGMTGTVKQWLVKNSNLCDLHDKLDSLVQFQEFKNLCRLERSLVTAAGNQYKQGAPRFLLDVQKHITPHAYSLALGQVAQIMSYSVQPAPGAAGEDLFLVTRQIDSDDVGVQRMEKHTNGRTKSHAIATDIGFRDTRRDHVVSSDTCSCQYPTAFGIPCRHILCVRTFKPEAVGNAFEDLFASRWIRKELRPSEAFEEPTIDPEYPDDPTVCYVALTDLMDTHGLEPREMSPTTSSFAINIYDQSYMAIKYGPTMQGGWHIAWMTAREVCDEMELYFLFSDKKRALWLCDTELMAKSPKYYESLPPRSWLLLTEKNLYSFQPTQCSTPQAQGPQDDQQTSAKAQLVEAL
jgi:hypothetical protein